MSCVQSKMKESLEKQTLSSIEKLSAQLGSNQENDELNSFMDQEQEEHRESIIVSKIDCNNLSSRGENKAPVAKKSRRQSKHHLRVKSDDQNKTQPTQKHRYHCEF
jgi:hypothetical protein